MIPLFPVSTMLVLLRISYTFELSGQTKKWTNVKKWTKWTILRNEYHKFSKASNWWQLSNELWNSIQWCPQRLADNLVEFKLGWKVFRGFILTKLTSYKRALQLVERLPMDLVHLDHSVDKYQCGLACLVRGVGCASLSYRPKLNGKARIASTVAP